MPYLQPERYFSRISHINIERDLLACGFRCVLLDIDNTILSRATHDVPRDVGLWLAQARDAGVSFCLVSNNWHKNVHELANRLSMPIIAKAMKPLARWRCSRRAPCWGRSERDRHDRRSAINRRACRAQRRHVGVSAGAACGAGPAPYRNTCAWVEQAILGGAVPEGAPQPVQASVVGKSAAQNAFAQEK